MKKYLPLLSLILLLVFTASKGWANRGIIAVEQQTSQVVQYEKVEFNISLSGAFENPYLQEDIRVDAIFTSPSGKNLLLPCYYVSGDETASAWKARFAPQESGIYSFKIEIRKGNALEATSSASSFTASASAKNGFLHAHNDWSFMFDSGKAFRGIGENMAWEPRTWENELHTYDYFLPRYAERGVNFFRTWMSGWNLPLEWKKVGDTDRYSDSDEYYNPQGIERMDLLVAMADSLELYMMLALDWHGHVSPGDWWDRSNYNAANGGPASSPAEFFTLEASRAQYKNRLRYLVARWGYSPSIGAWEFFNEVDNAVNASNIPHSAVTSWHTEMSSYLAEIDPYDHLMTTSISHDEIAGLNAIPEIDFNQKHIYRNTGAIPSTLNQYVNSTNKPYVIGEFGYEWDWNVDFSTIEDEKIFDYKRGLWYGLFNPTPILPMSWWWEFFDPRGTNAYFASVREISERMLLAGNGSFTALSSSASGLETYGMKAGDQYFVYILNNSSSAAQEKEVSVAIAENGSYKVKSYDPETRNYTDLGEMEANENNLVISGLSLRARESRVILLSNPNDTYESSPFRGEALPVPGKIEAEDFDLGGQGMAYHDLEAANSGGAYRIDEGVDIEASATGGFNVTDIVPGEWIKYTVNVEKSGVYQLDVRLAAAEKGKHFLLEIEGSNIIGAASDSEEAGDAESRGAIEVPNTGGMQNWETLSINTRLLKEGQHVLYLYASTGGFNLDHFSFTLINQASLVGITSPAEGASFELPAEIEIVADASDEDGTVEKVEFFSGNTSLGEVLQAPYTIRWEPSAGEHQLKAIATDDKGLEVSSSLVNISVLASQKRSPNTESGDPHSIPGIIQAEDFDQGAAGVAYHDLTPGNIYSAYRPDTDVDIEESTDEEGSGFNLADIQAGEWVEYTVLVEEAGTYNIALRVATQSAGQHFHVEMNGQDVTGRIDVPNTGGWQSWETIEKKGLALKEGEQIMRLVFATEFFNLQHLSFSKVDNITAINDQNGINKGAFRIKPNPSNEHFNLLLNENTHSIKVINMQGAEVYHLDTHQATEVQFGGQLNAGLYVVLINYKNGQTKAQRVLKIK